MLKTLRQTAGKAKRSWLLDRKKRMLKHYARTAPCRVIIGAGATDMEGWFPTDIDCLNILEETNYQAFLRQGQ